MRSASILNASFLGQILFYTSVFANAEPLDYPGKELGPAPAIMVPVDNYHRSLNRRDEERLDPQNLALRGDELLQWGSINEDGSLLRAKMDIISHDGTKLLFMSRFHGFTESVDCSIADGDGLAITFKSQEFLDLAKKQWGWLNEDEGNQFWMITNHIDCDKDDDPLNEYVPYLITDVEYEGLTAEFVKSEKKTMTEALQNFKFDLQFGQAELAEAWNTTAPAFAGLEKRGLFDWWDDVTTFEHNVDGEVVLDYGTPGERFRIGEGLLPDDKELSCVDCYLHGKFKYGGRLLVEDLVKVEEVSFFVQPEDVKLMLKFNAKFGAAEYAKVPIPLFSKVLSPFEIPGIFSLGPKIALSFQFGYEIRKDLDFEFGIEAGFPNDAKISNNLMEDDDSVFENWDKSYANALPFDLKSGELDVMLEAGPTVSLSFGYSITLIGGHEIALRAGLPHWVGNYKSFVNGEGACEQNPDAHKVGVDIEQSIKTDLRFFAGATGFMDNGELPKVDKELWKWEKVFDKECKGIQSMADDPEIKDLIKKLNDLESEEGQLNADIEKINQELEFLDQNPTVPEANATVPMISGVPANPGSTGAPGTVQEPEGYNATIPGRHVGGPGIWMTLRERLDQRIKELKEEQRLKEEGLLPVEPVEPVAAPEPEQQY